MPRYKVTWTEKYETEVQAKNEEEACDEAAVCGEKKSLKDLEIIDVEFIEHDKPDDMYEAKLEREG